MEHLLLFSRDEVKQFLLQRKIWFLIFSILSAYLTMWLFGLDKGILLPAFTSALITTFCLGTVSNIRIDSMIVRIGWGLISFSLFIITASLLLLEEPYGNVYILSIIGGAAVWILVYVFCPAISYRLKLNDRKMGYSLYNGKHKYNGCYLFTILAAIYFVLIVWKSAEQKTDYQFSQEKWQTVQEWHTEIMNGNTYYIVKYSKGRVGINPQEYPEIRDICEKTKIKCLTSGDKSLFTVVRLEIKN